ncbi:hypothetical protein EV644_10522 [Kribbella orskensis]|uniref:Uncharacterized protein n=1 Tax=Kribbella orskensis TaxID=2512216 RepID=A0ABY2BLI4_9ACTN|nr:hypothetical protein EV642_10422 [Kribbella sp. VKM Ac-2500]TCO23992.1 hypothetical protein EV644_10522 [Kribbella orskensis]
MTVAYVDTPTKRDRARGETSTGRGAAYLIFVSTQNVAPVPAP